jgi:hypothetical protein
MSKVISYLTVVVIIISSFISFPKQMTNVSWDTNTAATRYISETISERIEENEMKNVNIVVLASEDPNIYGRRYRDLLLLKNINLKTKGEYETSDSLFVITTSSLGVVRGDPAYEIKFFKDGPLVDEWEVPESPWKVYLLSRPI